MFQGALEAARGRPVDATAAGTGIEAPRDATERRRDHVAPGVETGEYGYETVYLLRARGGHPLDIPAIQRHLEGIGDSVLVAGDPAMAKIHVHNDRPDAVISYGLSIGTLSRITIENLDGQAHDVRDVAATAFLAEGGVGTAIAATAVAAGPRGVGDAGDQDDRGPGASRLPLGIVAVVPSDGLAELFDEHAAGFKEFVAVRIVRGGQSANPSTGELLEAVEATPADELLILPNNPNVILAARQVASMTDRPIHVVPTRNCAEGFASLLGLDPSDPVAENVRAMTEASREAQTMQVTEAVRDATVSGRKVREGQTIALDPDDGLLAVDGDPHKAVLAALGKLEPGYGVITIYYGEGSSLDDAERLSHEISEAAPGLEAVDVLHGGQPHYRYLISAE